jgi:hypothetical protein
MGSRPDRPTRFAADLLDSAAEGSFGRAHLAKGFATVALDENGALMCYAPDGSVTPMPTSGTTPASTVPGRRPPSQPACPSAPRTGPPGHHRV